MTQQREPGKLSKDERDLLQDIIAHGRIIAAPHYRPAKSLVEKKLARDETPDKASMTLVATEAGRAVAAEASGDG